MSDKFDAKTRSYIMSRIRGKNTSVELLVFKFLRTEGVYFQKHYKRVVGNPDIALPRKKRAVFIDGDFWHGKDYRKRKATLPEYWVGKISKNMKRDKKYEKELESLGWNIMRVWEGDLRKQPESTLYKIKAFLTS